MIGIAGQVSRMVDRMREHVWIVPFGMVLLAIGIAFSIEALDSAVQGHIAPVWWLFSGGEKVARQLLTAIAAAMVAIITMAFSNTVTALTFIAQHYGSQVLRSFMRNLTTQIVMGHFLATFVYALLILRTVHSVQDDASLPRIAVTFGIVLAVISLAILIYFLYHLSEQMDAPNIVAQVAHDLDRVIYRTTQDLINAEPPREAHLPETPETETQAVESMTSGYVQKIDEERLAEIAGSHDVTVRLHCRVGAFVTRGDALATVWPGNRIDRLTDRIRASVLLGAKRTLEQDIEFGIDQLVQVAIRGLSPGRNDTFTTMLCLDRLGAALSTLAGRAWPSAIRFDRNGRALLITVPETFPKLVDHAFGQIHSFGGETAIVAIRLLETVKTIARHVRRDEDREALRQHALAVHRESRNKLQDTLGIDEIERAFEETMKAIEDPRSLSATSRGPRALQS